MYAMIRDGNLRADQWECLINKQISIEEFNILMDDFSAVPQGNTGIYADADGFEYKLEK